MNAVLLEHSSPLRLRGDAGSPLLYLEFPPPTAIIASTTPLSYAARVKLLESVVADVVASLDECIELCVVRDVEQSWSPGKKEICLQHYFLYFF